MVLKECELPADYTLSCVVHGSSFYSVTSGLRVSKSAVDPIHMDPDAGSIWMGSGSGASMDPIGSYANNLEPDLD
ncbi:hypothetical protein R1flu_024015 [Riccia fluitans]|uniref:Recombination activating protein 2 n=1 Tax=Riccia fluitans TaxID=41844 RepID=A0ABD1XTN7_9MARC